MTRGKVKQLRALIEQLSATLDDETALTGIELFPAWRIEDYEFGDRRRHNDKLYKCVQAHAAQDNWTPDIVPALWAIISIEEYPLWVQPTGAQDAYMTGDKVTFEGKRYTSVIDNNTWSPTAYPQGWKLLTP